MLHIFSDLIHNENIDSIEEWRMKPTDRIFLFFSSKNRFLRSFLWLIFDSIKRKRRKEERKIENICLLYGKNEGSDGIERRLTKVGEADQLKELSLLVN